jgi:hypothetical protein
VCDLIDGRGALGCGCWGQGASEKLRRRCGRRLIGIGRRDGESMPLEHYLIGKRLRVRRIPVDVWAKES